MIKINYSVSTEAVSNACFIAVAKDTVMPSAVCGFCKGGDFNPIDKVMHEFSVSKV
ncbi:MAG: hypothetical protein ACC612_13000 [Methanomethylovorans sp.]|uniref:hypothetical protein n=1 Tax=Methanomethylovorans sp. TaxID=2758717 RepID=UPI00353156D5